MPDEFRFIPSQTTTSDQQSLLALKDHVGSNGRYTYLEIGSHLGGSLQPFVVDDRCEHVISIDPRPASQPDERGYVGRWHYEDNSTERMLSLLARVPGANLEKIATIEKGTEAIDPASILDRPALCFIDGEHSDFAALRDALFCATVAPTAIVAFHDRGAVARGISSFMHVTGGYGHPLPSTIFVVDLGGRGRFDHLQRRPWLWRAANSAGVAAEAVAVSPAFWCPRSTECGATVLPPPWQVLDAFM